MEGKKVRRGDPIFPAARYRKGDCRAGGHDCGFYGGGEGKRKKDAANVPGGEKGFSGGKPEITIEDFEKIDLRVGEVVACEKHPKADKLLVFQVRIGDEVRQIVPAGEILQAGRDAGKTCDCGGKSEVHQAERTGVQRDDSLRRQRGTPGNRNHRSAGRKSGEIDNEIDII